MSRSICYFGLYDPDYSRNRILMQGLRKLGYSVTQCRVDPRSSGRISKYWHLVREYRRVAAGRRFSYVIVGFPGHSVVWLAWLLFGRRVIFDAYVSIFDVNVYDRRKYSALSIMGVKDWCTDWLGMRLASRVLLDTNEHISYVASLFRVPRSKFIRVLIGADEEMFMPRDAVRTTSDVLVHFHGSFIPVQGIEHIIQAATRLKDEHVRFRIIGDGQPFDTYAARIEEMGLSGVVELPGRLPMDEIPERIAEADICLGIFGAGGKTQRVIPNKVYEYAAMGKAVISGETLALREVFRADEVVGCEVANPVALAEAIRGLNDDANRRAAFGERARERYLQSCTSVAVAQRLVEALEHDEE